MDVFLVDQAEPEFVHFNDSRPDFALAARILGIRLDDAESVDIHKQRNKCGFRITLFNVFRPPDTFSVNGLTPV